MHANRFASICVYVCVFVFLYVSVCVFVCVHVCTSSSCTCHRPRTARTQKENDGESDLISVSWSTVDCSLDRCAGRDQTVPEVDVAPGPPRQQMKPIGLNLSHADGTRGTHVVMAGERRASTGADTCTHPAVGMKPIVPLGRSASSGKLYYIRERHEGEDLLANLLRLRNLMLNQNVHT